LRSLAGVSLTTCLFFCCALNILIISSNLVLGLIGIDFTAVAVASMAIEFNEAKNRNYFGLYKTLILGLIPDSGLN
jgi:hypothetical protein